MGQGGGAALVRHALFARPPVAANLAANLAGQRVVLAAAPSPEAPVPAIAAGTPVRPARYRLDRRFVFPAGAPP